LDRRAPGTPAQLTTPRPNLAGRRADGMPQPDHGVLPPRGPRLTGRVDEAPAALDRKAGAPLAGRDLDLPDQAFGERTAERVLGLLRAPPAVGLPGLGEQRAFQRPGERREVRTGALDELPQLLEP